MPGSITSSSDGVEHARLAAEARERGLAVARDVHLVPVGLEVEAQAHREVGLVLDHQQARHQVRTIRGSSMVNVEPRPSPSLVADTRPPC